MAGSPVADRPKPSPPSNTNTCDNAPFIVDLGQEFATADWDDVGIQNPRTIDVAGPFPCTITDTLGCVSNVSVTVDQVFQHPTVDLGDDRDICEGESDVLNAGPGFNQYQWSNQATTQAVSVLFEGIYEVTVTDGNGCTGQDDVEVTIHPNPVLPVGFGLGSWVAFADAYTTVNLTVNTGWDQILWEVNNLPNFAVNDPNFSFEVQPGGHLVTANVVSVFGCETEEVLAIESWPLGTNDLAERGGLTLFPNPSFGQVTLQAGTAYSSANLLVSDVTGKQVFQKQIPPLAKGSQMDLDLSGLAKGTYFLEFRSNMGRQFFKLAIE